MARIAVIGAPDSVRLVHEIAREMDLETSLVRCPYKRSFAEAPQLAMEAQEVASVVLFTGRLPYLLTAAENSWRAELTYIPHEGVDLYRTLAKLLLMPEFHGRVPRVSLDSIAPEIAGEAFADIGVPAPVRMLDLDVTHETEGFDAQALAERHAEGVRSGDVELCLTCVQAVYAQLAAWKLPAVRIMHSRTSIREALTRAALTVALARAEAAQIAVCVIRRRTDIPDLDGARGPRLRAMNEIASRYAVLLSGAVASTKPTEAVIHTSRGAVDRHARPAQGSVALQTEFRDRVSIGIGFGTATQQAEEHARRAVEFAERLRMPCLCTDAGVIMPLGSPDATIETTTTHEATLHLAQTLGVSPTSLHKLRLAFREVDPAAFTARQLAAAYGVQSRSARRIIAALERADIVTTRGVQHGTGAGRPQVVYEVDLNRLLPSYARG